MLGHSFIVTTQRYAKISDDMVWREVGDWRWWPDLGGGVRLIDSDGERAPDHVQLYLSPDEARRILAELGKLIADPESAEHFHLIPEDGGGELSCSIVTPGKLTAAAYTSGERRAFGGWKPRG